MHYLLQDELQLFIRSYTGKNPSELALKKNPFPEIPMAEIIGQIESRIKCETKLPTWFKTEQLIYPPKISVEQSSSELTAKYKASLVSGNSLIDLTGGFGVDAFFFKQQFHKVVHCEHNPALSALVAHNFKILEADIECRKGDGLETLKQLQQKFDVIYIDPSRRHQSKGKVFHLEDYEPNVVQDLKTYLDYSQTLLIKVSPLLDIQMVLNTIPYIKEIHLVAVQNEVKEFLILIKKGFSSSPMITAVNLQENSSDVFTFDWNAEKSIQHQNFSPPKSYLYEPNAAIMKSGGFGTLGNSFPVSKLHKNSHLFTSDNIIEFPGRSFKINECLPYQKSSMREFLKNKKANISVRNFPEDVKTLKTKWKIADGGDHYLFFTTDVENNKIVLLCEKM